MLRKKLADQHQIIHTIPYHNLSLASILLKELLLRRLSLTLVEVENFDTDLHSKVWKLFLITY